MTQHFQMSLCEDVQWQKRDICLQDSTVDVDILESL